MGRGIRDTGSHSVAAELEEASKENGCEACRRAELDVDGGIISRVNHNIAPKNLV